MRVVIVGCGRVGSQLALLLAAEGNDVVIVDVDPDSFRRLGGAFNGVTVVGYGYDEETLHRAGIDRCDAFAAVTDLDNSNLMAAEVAAKIFSVPRVVARVYNTERERTFQQLGIDYVCGTTMVAQAFLDKISTGHGHHLTTRGGLELIEFIAGEAMDAKRIIDIQIPNEFRVCLVTREGESFIPWRETLLRQRDIILAVVKDSTYPKIRKYMKG